MLHALALRVFGALPPVLKTRVVRLLYPTFTAGVAVCLTDPEGRLLLVTHSYSAGWGLPGGLMGRNEEPAETARREMHEELGLDIAFAAAHASVKTPGRYHLNMLFKAELDAAQAAAVDPDTPEITGHGFHALDDLPELSEFTELFLQTLGVADSD